MKLTKIIALSIALITFTGVHAGWLDDLLGTNQPAQAQSQPQQAQNDWVTQLRGMLGEAQKPAAAPAQLGMPAVGTVPAQAAEVGAIRQNIATMISKVKEMAPAITVAITNKDFTSIAKLAEPAKDILSLGITTAKSIQQVVAVNPQMKGVVVGLVNELNPMITPLVAQIRSMAETAGWGKRFILKTIASGLEQVPQLLNAAAGTSTPAYTEKG